MNLSTHTLNWLPRGISRYYHLIYSKCPVGKQQFFDFWEKFTVVLYVVVSKYFTGHTGGGVVHTYTYNFAVPFLIPLYALPHRSLPFLSPVPPHRRAPFLPVLGSLCPLARSKPSGHLPCSNKAALLSMTVMITSFAAAPGVAFCNTIWPLWALVSPI